jgi:hypothetical protein
LTLVRGAQWRIFLLLWRWCSDRYRPQPTAGVGEVLAEAEVLCTAMLENRVFDRLYSLIKSVLASRDERLAAFRCGKAVAPRERAGVAAALWGAWARASACDRPLVRESTSMY